MTDIVERLRHGSLLELEACQAEIEQLRKYAYSAMMDTRDVLAGDKSCVLEERAKILRNRIHELRIDYPEAADARRDELVQVEAAIRALAGDSHD